MQTIKYDAFDNILKEDEAFFLYLQNFDTEASDLVSCFFSCRMLTHKARVKKSLDPILGSVPAYTSADPQYYANFSIVYPPTSVLLAFSNHYRRPSGSLPFPAEQQALDRFIDVHRYPTLTHLNAANYDAIMKADSRAIVVLAALHKGEEGEKEKEKLLQVARAWKRGGRAFSQPVRFCYVEGESWRGWLRQSYGIKKKDLPAVVVVDPPVRNDQRFGVSMSMLIAQQSEYYDRTIEGNNVSFDGAAIFSVLEGFYQHFLVPKRVETTLQWGSRSATNTLINLSVSDCLPSSAITPS